MHPGPHSSILKYPLQPIREPGHCIVRLPNPCTAGGATLDFAKIARRPSGHCPHQATRLTNRVWPGITNEIVTLIKSCQSCQERLSSQPQEPLMRDPLPTRVFEDVSTDLFQSGQLHVLVYADRLSGWPVIHRWRHDPSAREVVQAVIENFVDLGVPVRLRSDGGPQFDSAVFQSALKRWGVLWSNSTPYYPQSNGHAEAAVSAMKELVENLPIWRLIFRGVPKRCS